MRKPGGNNYPWQILYHPKVVHDDIPRLCGIGREMVKRAVETKLLLKPEFYGFPLRGTLKGYWKLRVAEWRVVFSLRSDTIYILVIAHRKDVYKMAQRRVL